jgi:intracellular multiplication protein IcmD
MDPLLKWIRLSLIGSVSFLAATAVFAQATDINSLVAIVQTEAAGIVTLIWVVSYIAGIGFALAAILQFKAHKDNPQQVSLSKPVVLLIVSACLLVLPTVTGIAGTSLFGAESTTTGTMTGLEPTQ